MRWMLAMLLFVPISIVLYFMQVPESWLFVTSSLAIVPLAGLLGAATEEYAKYRGAAIGGLLNATFGNATELIIAIVAVQHNEIAVVKASLIGSVIGNVLLVLGLSLFLGGLKYKHLEFNPDQAQMHATMLGMAAVSLLIPALFVRNVPGIVETAKNPQVENLSLGVAGVLIALYVGSLVFSLWTHESLFRGGEEEETEKPTWTKGVALTILFVSTIFIAVESEILVHSISRVVTQWHLSKLFLGVILVPIIGNAAEHSTAIVMALRNKLDISMNIAVSSSTQIAMFVAPLIIFLSLWMGHPITVLFTNFELIAVSAAILIAVLISIDGKSNWLEGAQLLVTYIIVAMAFFFIPR